METSFLVGAATTQPFASTFVIQIDAEEMLVTGVNTTTNTFTVTRGYNGTVAADHLAAATVHLNYGSRADYVNLTREYDHGIDAATGCGMLFLYYLSVQLGFSVPQIIAAAPGISQAQSCLRGVYQNLTGDESDPFPFFKTLLDDQFPPNEASTVPGPNPDNPWPYGLLTFWGEKNTWGLDEVTDMVHSSSGTYPDGFWLMLEGFNKQVTGSATPSAPTVEFTGTTTSLDPAGIAYESTNPLVPQRIRYPYDVDFASSALGAFPSSGETPAAVKTAISLSGGTFPANSEFFFIAGADPYFTNVLPNPNPEDENAPYLSADLRVFSATPGLDRHPVPGAPSFSTDTFDGAYTYIQSLLGWLNTHHGDPSQPDPFDPANNIIPGQLTALNGDSSVTPWTASDGNKFSNYNFAVARVRLRGTRGSQGAAPNVKVFFRLWGTQTADTDWDPSYTYLSHTDSSNNPLWPLAPPDNHTIPFFATSNAPDLADVNNPEYGSAGINNKTITIEQGDTQWAYFGCFLNLYDQSFLANGDEVMKSFPGTHHCLVAQIAYAGAPIEEVGSSPVTPESSSQLAQRNLQVTASDNPGPASTHRIPQTFDTRLSAPTTTEAGLLSEPDELMIDWETTPVGSVAQIYWPGVAATEVVDLAAQLYPVQLLSASDTHTIQCSTTKGVTYVPIPFGTGESLAGLLTVDLPPTVHNGQQFDIVVRRISSRRLLQAQAPPPPRPQVATRRRGEAAGTVATDAVAERVILQRYVVGSFRVTIPVSIPSKILPAEESTLAILKARLQSMPTSDRWYPVLLRYIDYVAGRVDGMGGNARGLPASFGGAPIGVFKHGGGAAGGQGPDLSSEHQRSHTGKVTGLIFDHFGDYEGFELDSGESEHRFDSREREVRDLSELAWRQRLRVTVHTEPDTPHRILRIVLRDPPAPF